MCDLHPQVDLHRLDQDFNTLDAQREACERYIEGQEHNGWQLIPEQYDDGGFTGANLERPAFQRLLADIEAGKIDIVVVYKVDRLSRSLLDFAQVMGRFNQAGAAFVSVTQNFSTADAMGRLTLNMLMLLNERGRTTKRHRAKNGNVREARKWTKDAVLRILRNPVLAGCMASGDELFEAEHTAIIDRARWRQAMEMLDRCS